MLTQPGRGVSSSNMPASALGVNTSGVGGLGVTSGTIPKNDSSGLKRVDDVGEKYCESRVTLNGEGRGIDDGAFGLSREGVSAALVPLETVSCSAGDGMAKSLSICGPKYPYSPILTTLDFLELVLVLRSFVLLIESAVEPRRRETEVLELLRPSDPVATDEVRLMSADNFREGGVMPITIDIRLSATLDGRRSYDDRRVSVEVRGMSSPPLASAKVVPRGDEEYEQELCRVRTAGVE
jgi:hypothetical protein